MTRAGLLALFLAAGPAAAQQTPPPAEQPSAAPAPRAPAKEERRPLNLQLDNPASFATIRPAEKEPAKGLPTLGGDARSLPQTPLGRDSNSPIPKDTNPTAR